MTRKLAGLDDILAYIETGAPVVINTSGGKDSQLTYLRVRALLAHLGRLDQLWIVHADLGRVEHDNTIAEIHDQLIDDDRLDVVSAIFKDGSPKDLINMIRRKAATLKAQGRHDVPPVPDAVNRTCTSDLKRGPVEVYIRNKVLGATKGSGLVINVLGFRAEESEDRAQTVEKPVEENTRLSRHGPRVDRTVINWYPLADFTVDEVFDGIHAFGQRAWSGYIQEGGGNTRKSCVFCILGCKTDWEYGATIRPELAKELSDLEEEIGFTLLNGQSVKQRLVDVLEIA